MDEKKMEGIELCERVNDEVYEIDQTLEAAGYGNRSQDFDNADGEFEEIDGEAPGVAPYVGTLPNMAHQYMGSHAKRHLLIGSCNTEEHS